MPDAVSATERSQELLERVPSEPLPDWFDFYDSTRLHGFAGYAFTRAGRFADAKSHLRTALDRLSPPAVKQRTVYQADLATVRLHQGDIDGACQLVADAAATLASTPSSGDSSSCCTTGILRHVPAMVALTVSVRSARGTQILPTTLKRPSSTSTVWVVGDAADQLS